MLSIKEFCGLVVFTELKLIGVSVGVDCVTGVTGVIGSLLEFIGVLKVEPHPTQNFAPSAFFLFDSRLNSLQTRIV